MPFGKHKGQLLRGVEPDYLEWLLSNCDLRPRLRSAVEAELRRREIEAEAAGPYRRSERQPLTDLRPVLSAWFRAMSLEFHGDRGGSDDQMRVVNCGYALLKKLVGLS
jgi:hypothetical protein